MMELKKKQTFGELFESGDFYLPLNGLNRNLVGRLEIPANENECNSFITFLSAEIEAIQKDLENYFDDGFISSIKNEEWVGRAETAISVKRSQVSTLLAYRKSRFNTKKAVDTKELKRVQNELQQSVRSLKESQQELRLLTIAFEICMNSVFGILSDSQPEHHSKSIESALERLEMLAAFRRREVAPSLKDSMKLLSAELSKVENKDGGLK